jgi:protein-disulfide isomerase
MHEKALRLIVGACAIALGAGVGGCRFTDDTWTNPSDTDFDSSVPSWDSGVDDDGGVGFACPEGSPDLFDNEFSPFIGGEESIDIVVVDFSFFKCPHCADFAAFWEGIWADRPDYRAHVRFYFHNFPFDYDSAWQVHAAAYAASNQGLDNFWALHDYIFSSLHDDGVTVSIDDIEAYCQDTLQLDMTQFEEDLVDPNTMSFLTWDKQQGVDAGVTGTPSVFVCGEKVSGWSHIEEAIDSYLTNH